MEKVKKENKNKIMEMIGKAGSEEYETSWDEKGVPTFKKKSKIERGKKSRAAGARFELIVRKNLEEMGWIVDKWTNTVDYEKLKLIPSKRKYNPFKKVMVIGTGFPDFVAFKKNPENNCQKFETIEDVNFSTLDEDCLPLGDFLKDEVSKITYDVIGVEVKSNGYLNQIEKGMCMWLLKNKIFSRILIAKKTKEGRKIIAKYIDFEEKFGKKFL